jgi:Spy/CpxP family protein refolding chaperone
MGRIHDRPPCWRPDDLRLTPEQTEKLKSIQARYLNDITALRNDLLHKKYELKRLMSDPRSKSHEIRRKQQEAFALETRIQEKVVDYRLKVREILTAQQFELWISRYQGDFGTRRGHRHGMGIRER